MTIYQIIETTEDIEGAYRPYGAAATLWRSKATEQFISGPAETGKSLVCLHKIDAIAWKYPKAHIAMLRKTRQSMDASILKTFLDNVMHPDIFIYGGHKPQWFDYPNGSRIVVGGLDNPNKVLSAEYDIIYVNQAEELNLDEWEKLLTRATGRAGHVESPQTIGDCNPGSNSHWILQRKQKQNILFLESRHEDNPTLYDPHTGQITPQGQRTMAVLDSLTGVRYQRLRLGKWVSAEGQIYDAYDAATHLIDRFDIPDDWRRFRVIDFGLVHPFVCYDDRTEILTEAGWMNFADLPRGICVAALSNSGRMIYQEPTGYIAHHYNGEMISSSMGRLGVNFCVTPNHQMVIENRKTNEIKKVAASDLPLNNDNWSIPVGWHPVDSGVEVDPAFARLVGLYIADGYLSNKGGGNYLKIAQKDCIEQVRDVITGAGYTPSEYKNKNGVIDFSVGNKLLFDRLWGMFGHVRSASKFIPRECFSWSLEARLALLEGLILGDGRKNTRDGSGKIQRTEAYFTISSQLADDVQELACTLGMASKITSQSVISSFTGKMNTVFKVSFHQFKRANVARLNVDRIPYDGMVYCVAVPDGTLIVRRNGRPMVCGNCQWWAADGDGRLYLYREIYMTGRTVTTHAKQINALSEGEHIEQTICDHDAEDRATLAENGIPNIAAKKDVLQGIGKVQDRLSKQDDGRARLFLLRDSLVEVDQELQAQHLPICTADEIDSYVWQNNSKKEQPVKENDHGVDTVRYMVMHLDGGSQWRSIKFLKIGQ